jgi:hypothetical protein
MLLYQIPSQSEKPPLGLEVLSVRPLYYIESILFGYTIFSASYKKKYGDPPEMFEVVVAIKTREADFIQEGKDIEEILETLSPKWNLRFWIPEK